MTELQYSEGRPADFLPQCSSNSPRRLLTSATELMQPFLHQLGLSPVLCSCCDFPFFISSNQLSHSWFHCFVHLSINSSGALPQKWQIICVSWHQREEGLAGQVNKEKIIWTERDILHQVVNAMVKIAYFARKNI